jgi:hypothetical protein
MSPLLLAIASQRKSFVYTRSWFSRQDPTVPQEIALVVALLGAGLFLGWVLMQWQARRGGPSRQHPMGLYLRLLRKLGLGLLDRLRMWRLARAQKIEHPTALLISRQLFDEVVARYLRQPLPAKTPPHPAFAAIRARLFPDAG